MEGFDGSGGDALFDLEGINIAYGKKTVLKNLDLKIGRGEKIALIGPSGAGKTTLLRKLYELKSHESAFIHQHYALVQQLSAFHNVYIGRLDRHSTVYNVLNLIRPQAREKEAILPIMEKLGISEKIFEKVGKLSGGQQQRVAVGRAMYLGGEIVLADEPVSSVDVHQGEAILKLIMETDKTVIASLHSRDFALRFASRVIGIREGKIIFDLQAEEVSSSLLKELYSPC